MLKIKNIYNLLTIKRVKKETKQHKTVLNLFISYIDVTLTIRKNYETLTNQRKM